MNQSLIHSVIAGVISGIVYALTAAGFLVGVLVFIAPAVPLFWAAFKYGTKALNHSCLAAFVVATAALGGDSAVIFMAYIAIPVWLFARHSLKVRPALKVGKKVNLPDIILDSLKNDGKIKMEWAPVSGAIMLLLIYAVLGLAASAIAVNMSGESLMGMIEVAAGNAKKTAPVEFRELIDSFVMRFPYLIIAFMIWLWASLIYGAASLAHFACRSESGGAMRPLFTLNLFVPPLWWLGVAAVFAISILSAEPDIKLVGTAISMVLMYPYFLMGILRIHHETKDWSNRKMWITGLYLMLFLVQMPMIVMLTCFGLYQHLILISKTSASDR